MVDKIKTYSSVITAIFSAAVVLYGVFKFVNQGIDNAKVNGEITVQLRDIKKAQLAPAIRLDSIERAIMEVDKTMNIVDRKVEKISVQFTNHLSKDKAITKDELIQIINDLDEKKN